MIRIASDIRRGLPVEVEAVIQSADPSVGIIGDRVEIQSIRWPSRRGKLGTEVPGHLISERDRQRLIDHVWESR